MELLRPWLTVDPQEELIERYCSEALALLKRVRSREEAAEVKQRICSKLAMECDSTLVLDATEAYVNGIIQRTWRKPPRGTDPTHNTH